MMNENSDTNKNLVDFDVSENNKLNKLPPLYASSPLTPPTGNGVPPLTVVTPPIFNIVTLNVSGLRFQTYVETLERYPNTLLGDQQKRQSFYNPQTCEYFFDRHRSSFESILYIYQSNGRLKRPESVPVDIYIKELKFFQMGREVMEKFWQSEGYIKPEEIEWPKNKCMKLVWQLMEHPDSSCCARIMAFFSVFVIIISTVSFCLETIPELKTLSKNYSSTWKYPTPGGAGDHAKVYYNDTVPTTDTDEQDESKMDWYNFFFLIEFSCICWFTIEFLLRFISCPSKLKFCKSILNIIDVVAIVPFFLNLCLSSQSGGKTMPFAVLRIFRLVRVFRIFKLSRHSRGLQILGKTFKASVQEFILLVFFMVLILVLFSSAIYFAESESKGTDFVSIPASFWFCIVTMTTVGYGDLVPKGPWGKLVGSFCAIIGVLVLALPVPVIVANFKHFYKQEKRLQHMQVNEGDGDEEYTEDDDNSGSS